MALCITERVKVSSRADWHHPERGEYPPYRYPGINHGGCERDRSTTVLILDGAGVAHVGFYDYDLCVWMDDPKHTKRAQTIRQQDDNGNYKLKWAHIGG